MMYCGMMKICEGIIIWSSTRPKKKFLPLNSSLANAYAAMVAVRTAQMTRKKISSSVFRYKVGKLYVEMTAVKFSQCQTDGN